MGGQNTGGGNTYVNCAALYPFYYQSWLRIHLSLEMSDQRSNRSIGWGQDGILPGMCMQRGADLLLLYQHNVSSRWKQEGGPGR